MHPYDVTQILLILSDFISSKIESQLLFKTFLLGAKRLFP
jgi:hypothetical protein